MPLLQVKNLEVIFPLGPRVLKALHGINLTVEKGQRVGLVGESGAGKSVAAFAICNLLSRPGLISSGEVLFEGIDLTKLNRQRMREIRGNRISMIFQDPMMTLNPVLTIETQMVEILFAHTNLSRRQALKLCLEKLEEVSIPSPEQRLKNYPHQLSGGMKQRIVIAMALLTRPSLIIADEPTTAIDVTIQAQIMALILMLCKNYQMSLILITHDLAVVGQVTEKLMVMYAGHIIEQGQTSEVLGRPHHPYTQGLIKALPDSAHQGQYLQQIPGQMPSLGSIPKGCAFHPRCPHADHLCHEVAPQLKKFHHLAKCHHTEKIWTSSAQSKN